MINAGISYGKQVRDCARRRLYTVRSYDDAAHQVYLGVAHGLGEQRRLGMSSPQVIVTDTVLQEQKETR